MVTAVAWVSKRRERSFPVRRRRRRQQKQANYDQRKKSEETLRDRETEREGRGEQKLSCSDSTAALASFVHPSTYAPTPVRRLEREGGGRQVLEFSTSPFGRGGGGHYGLMQQQQVARRANERARGGGARPEGQTDGRGRSLDPRRQLPFGTPQ